MSVHLDAIGMLLATGPKSAQQLIDSMGISQPTLSRALSRISDEVVRLGAARSIQYTLRDAGRGIPDILVYRVTAEGQICSLGTLVPVRPQGFVMQQVDGVSLHSDGLPWWLFDMQPQGFLGRAYAARYAATLGLPARLSDWRDEHALRALLAHGHDVVGNLLLGDIARDRFLSSALPVPVGQQDKAGVYQQLALDAANSEAPGSSAGGEQPKFVVYAETPVGPRHLLVKFSESEDHSVSERWRDLLLAEHLALETLRAAGIPAAKTYIFDDGGQRFLEVERFDRVGRLGRRALHSLSALDAEFVGSGDGNWPQLSRRLAQSGQIEPQAVALAALLWAFGTLIGNTDMHNGNLSFIAEHGRPYVIAPAYDMTVMGFAPRSGGGLPASIAPASITADVSNDIWRQAGVLAGEFLNRVRASDAFTPRFAACVIALETRLEMASAAIVRLA
ncbi:type II toxin-antitoxin system HipA family toxin YjjJ [Methylophilus medardicus]|uniref:Type II toxin-antitoxin system HipA family toxin YjjJ n=1 Tax=Methylophilus medardicus TaxID=2588534 RepID=A0A5B8CTW3_9PROT|nr:type II toxin-antitoxin system HipA family toxin YjjJ [Methylophilus medardicus]QDC44355.1 type II toxin-antitoxin system HipA family toxin YjjJ [Methylophilus medardicus]QDC49362.1 type II toxin-antitoxin system HipA family toxin YjjJ [Methylophilus medardicus]QDC53067.1 type II toxin-antitoxin system HipA family toxin YjjJ [Methylophilus medardicus]